MASFANVPHVRAVSWRNKNPVLQSNAIQLWTHDCGHVPHERAVTWILLTVPTLDIEVDVESRDNEEEEGEDIYI